jgi:hypothetical protein
MNMVIYEGLEQIYISKSEPIRQHITLAAEQWTIASMPDVMRRKRPLADDWRPLIVRDTLHKPKAYVYYLFWNTPIDLDELDEKVKSRQHTPEDFQNAIVTEYQRLTHRGTKTWWHTLSIPNTSFLFTHSAKRDFHNRDDFEILNAPTGESFRQSVVKIVGVASSPLVKRQRYITLVRADGTIFKSPSLAITPARGQRSMTPSTKKKYPVLPSLNEEK